MIHEMLCARRIRTGDPSRLLPVLLLVCHCGLGWLEAEAPSPARLAEGRAVYQRNCQVCHGPSGDGRGEMAKELIPLPRSFLSGRFKYQSTPRGFLPSDEDLRLTIRSGVAGTSMPAFGQLSDREVEAVLAYLKNFSKVWRDPARISAPIVFPSAPDWMFEPASREHRAKDALARFQTHCAPCHGLAGDGRSPVASTLVDDWEQADPPRDLVRGPFRLGHEPQDLFRGLTLGIGGTPMPGFESSLTVEERWEMVALLLELSVHPDWLTLPKSGLDATGPVPGSVRKTDP